MLSSIGPLRSCPTIPSSSSACALVNKQPGAVFKVAGHLLGRAVLLMPGLLVAGVSGKNLIKASILGSAGITAFLLIYTAAA